MLNRLHTLVLLSALVVVCTARAADDAKTAPSQGDTRDVLLLLPDGPLHIRFHVTLGGKPLSQVRAEYIDRLIERLDQDQDGRLSQQERRRSPLFSYGRKQFENEFLQSLKTARESSRADVERDLLRFGELFSYRQDDSAAENDQEVLRVLDADESGRIEAREIRTAVVRVAELDSDRDQCISFQEFRPDVPEPNPMLAVLDPNAENDVPKPTRSRAMRDTGNLTLSRDLLRAYDSDRDRKLSADELGWSGKRLSEADIDGDGHLSIGEMRNLDELPIDLELTVDLSEPADESDAAGKLVVLQGRQDRRLPSPRPDIARIGFGETKVTFSFRPQEPVQAALENAMQQFNLLDVDANGYLDRDEIADNLRFERTLFDAMDGDEDDKLFAEEMKSYVTALCEPAATTCQVNVYDTGQGYFQILDVSGDGRISIRELRQLEQTLAAHEKQKGAGISPEDLGRHYHIEFVRGSFQVFGPSQRMIAQGPTFIEREAVGPVWFRGMDRNRDGDLTYLVGDVLYPPEFLGPPESAAALDVDQDGLISAVEAERAAELWGETGQRQSPDSPPADPAGTAVTGR